MPIFRCQGLEDPKQFWFIVEAVWKSQQINDNDMKKEQMVTMLKDISVTCYIRYNTNHPTTSLANMKDALNVEFTKPKLKAQCVIDNNETKKRVNKSTWDIDQQLKCLLSQANLKISNEQHGD